MHGFGVASAVESSRSQSFGQVYLMSRGECSFLLSLQKAVDFMGSVVCLAQVWQNDYNPLFHYRAFLRSCEAGKNSSSKSERHCTVSGLVEAIVENRESIPPIEERINPQPRWANTCTKSDCAMNHTRLDVHVSKNLLPSQVQC